MEKQNLHRGRRQTDPLFSECAVMAGLVRNILCGAFIAFGTCAAQVQSIAASSMAENSTQHRGACPDVQNADCLHAIVLPPNGVSVDSSGTDMMLQSRPRRGGLIPAVPAKSEWDLGLSPRRKNTVLYSVAAALAAGCMTAYSKHQANYYDDRYHAEGRAEYRGMRNRYDVAAGVSLVAAELSLTILSYVLLVQK